MQPTDFIEQETEIISKLRLFSLYVDFAASRHAKWASGAIAKLVGPTWKATSEMWNLDLFEASRKIGKMMLREAAEADVLIIAHSSLEQPDPKLIEWLDALAGEKMEHHGNGLLIGLLGDEEHEASELEWTVKQFIRCAQRMGRDFIWQWMGQEAVNDTTWLINNVEKFLAHKRSRSVQGIAPSVGQLSETIRFFADTD